MIGVPFLTEARDFLLHRVEAGSGAHLAPWSLSTGVKRLGRETHHSPLSSAEINNCEALPPLHSAPLLMAWCLLLAHRATLPPLMSLLHYHAGCVSEAVEFNKTCVLKYLTHEERCGARGSLVAKALCYEPEGRGLETR
jgi:hypothetical protein